MSVGRRSPRWAGAGMRWPHRSAPAPLSSCLGFRDLVAAINDDVGTLEGDEPAANHAIELWQDAFDLFRRIHTLDDQGKIQREPEHLGAVNARARAEAHDASQHCGAGEPA